MDKRTDEITPKFVSNLAMMVIYLPAKFEFDWTKRFRVKSPETEMLTDKRTKNSQTNGWNDTNFERNLAMMVVYVSVKFEFD